MELDALSPEMRRDLRDAFDRLADLLDEETGCLPRADAEALGLYAEAKRGLFEQLGILLREAKAPPLPHLIAALPPADTTAEGLPTAAPGPSEADGEDVEADGVEAIGPGAPEAVRAAALRLKRSVAENARSITAAQDAVAAVARHLARAVDRQHTDGVYARHGTTPGRGQPGFGRVEHEL